MRVGSYILKQFFDGVSDPHWVIADPNKAFHLIADLNLGFILALAGKVDFCISSFFMMNKLNAVSRKSKNYPLCLLIVVFASQVWSSS
jgi:hypothetical protein